MSTKEELISIIINIMKEKKLTLNIGRHKDKFRNNYYGLNGYTLRFEGDNFMVYPNNFPNVCWITDLEKQTLDILYDLVGQCFIKSKYSNL